MHGTLLLSCFRTLGEINRYQKLYNFPARAQCTYISKLGDLVIVSTFLQSQ